MFGTLYKLFWDKKNGKMRPWSLLTVVLCLIEGDQNEGIKPMGEPWRSMACYCLDCWIAWQNLLGWYAFELETFVDIVDEPRRPYFVKKRVIPTWLLLILSPFFFVATLIFDGWKTFHHFWILQKNAYFEGLELPPEEKSPYRWVRRYIFGFLGLPFAIVSGVLLFPAFIVYESYHAFMFFFKGIASWALYFDDGLGDFYGQLRQLNLNTIARNRVQELPNLDQIFATDPEWSFKQDIQDFVTGMAGPYHKRSRIRFIAGFPFAIPGMLLGCIAAIIPLMVAITIESFIGILVGAFDTAAFLLFQNGWPNDEHGRIPEIVNQCRAFYIGRTRSILGLPGLLYGTALDFVCTFVTIFLSSVGIGFWFMVAEVLYGTWIENRWVRQHSIIQPLVLFFGFDQNPPFFVKLVTYIGFPVGIMLGAAIGAAALPLVFTVEMVRTYFFMCCELLQGACQPDYTAFRVDVFRQDILLDHISIRWLGHIARLIGMVLSSVMLTIVIPILLFQGAFIVARLMLKQLDRSLHLRTFLFETPQDFPPMTAAERPSLLRVLFGLPLGLPAFVIASTVLIPLVLIVKMVQESYGAWDKLGDYFWAQAFRERAEFDRTHLKLSCILFGIPGYIFGLLQSLVVTLPLFIFYETGRSFMMCAGHIYRALWGQPAIEDTRSEIQQIVGNILAWPLALVVVGPIALIVASFFSAWYGEKGCRIRRPQSTVPWVGINSWVARHGGVLLSGSICFVIVFFTLPLFFPPIAFAIWIIAGIACVAAYFGAKAGEIGVKHFFHAEYWAKNTWLSRFFGKKTQPDSWANHTYSAQRSPSYLALREVPAVQVPRGILQSDYFATPTETPKPS